MSLLVVVSGLLEQRIEMALGLVSHLGDGVLEGAEKEMREGRGEGRREESRKMRKKEGC